MKCARLTSSALYCCCAAFPALGMSQVQAAPHVTFDLPVVLYSGASYPEMKPTALIEVHLNFEPLKDEFDFDVPHGWNCASKSSYAVTVSGSAKPLPIAAILPIREKSCQTSPVLSPVLIQLNTRVDATTEYIVTLVGLPSGNTVASKPLPFPAATVNSFSILPKASPAQSLTNGKTRDVGQLDASYSAPFIAATPFFLNSKNTFSTDAKDTQSAFAVTAGLARGLLNGVYVPAKFSQTIQGNQTATALSAVSSFSVTGLVPWSSTHKALNNDSIDAPLAPEFSFAALYTHRFAQQVTAKTPLLSENDASLNPSLVIEPFFLFPKFCERYRNWIKAKPDNNPSHQFCLGYQIDLGAWYLPMDKTRLGSQRFEGYGTATFMIPLSNFNFNKYNFIQQDNLLGSQISIQYSDSVNPANNFARSRKWTFGIGVMK